MTHPRRDLLKAYLEYTDLIRKMRGTVMQVITHPDATDEQILDVAKRYRDVVQLHAKARAKTLEAFTHHHVLYDQVQRANI